MGDGNRLVQLRTGYRTPGRTSPGIRSICLVQVTSRESRGKLVVVFLDKGPVRLGETRVVLVVAQAISSLASTFALLEMFV